MAANSYFVPGYGISRAVIQNEIHYYCGPQSIVRPYVHQVSLVDICCEIVVIAARLTRSSGTRRFPGHHLGTSIDPGSLEPTGSAVPALTSVGANRRSEGLIPRVRREAIPDSERIERLREPACTST
jgi:hypothetical protein